MTVYTKCSKSTSIHPVDQIIKTFERMNISKTYPVFYSQNSLDNYIKLLKKYR